MSKLIHFAIYGTIGLLAYTFFSAPGKPRRDDDDTAAAAPTGLPPVAPLPPLAAVLNVPAAPGKALERPASSTNAATVGDTVVVATE